MVYTGAERAYGKLEPTVINEELLTYASFAEGPKGEAGRLAEIEGIAFDSVKKLRLSYQNILLIGGLKQFTSLTELLLDNNIIEKIEGLDYLENLRRLDLSFNNIHQIENLEKLISLEDLSLFHNFIERIENLDMNRKLRFLSLGRNGISNLQDMLEIYFCLLKKSLIRFSPPRHLANLVVTSQVAFILTDDVLLLVHVIPKFWAPSIQDQRFLSVLYLRRFKSLDCLSLEDNPVCSHPDYNIYIFAFLPKLKYLDYKKILPEWKVEAYEKFAITVDQMAEQQAEEESKAAEEEEARLFMLTCKAAFIDRIYGDNLFNAIFEKDADGKRLCQVSTIEELVKQYKEKVIDACKQLFQTGLDEYRKRQADEEALRVCIEEAKQTIKDQAITCIQNYETEKREIFRKLAEIEADAFPVLTEALLTDIRQHIHDLWSDLMTDELALVDQIEDVINEFERNLEEKIGSFIEAVQACFSKIREAAITFNERLAELTLTYAERIAKTEGPQDESYAIYADRDFVINALSNSKDTHVNVIDSTEEGILRSARSWFNELIEDIHGKEENQRHTNRVTEINLYVDAQRVDLESLDLALIQ